MISIKKLYFEIDTSPVEAIKPIYFKKGINLIIGEKSEEVAGKNDSEKMNGVGKSMSIEAINFCLFKGFSSSRIAKVPEKVLPRETYICLDIEFEVGDRIKEVTIRRPVSQASQIMIIEDDDEKSFDDVEEAKAYFEHIAVTSNIEARPTFRQMMSILIREEKTSYDNILRPYLISSASPYSELLKPHMFLFHFDIAKLDQVNDYYKQLDKTKRVMAEIKDSFKRADIDIKDVRSHINDLEDKVDKLDLAVEGLRPAEGVDQRNRQLEELLAQLEELVGAKSAKEFAIRRIKKMPKAEKVNTKQLAITYNRFKENLGDLVKKSFDEVIDFKNQVDDFQNTLMSSKLHELEDEVGELSRRIALIDGQIASIYAVTGAKEKIADLKESVRAQQQRHSELEQLTASYKLYENKKRDQDVLSAQKDKAVESIQLEIDESRKNIENFEDNLKDIHEFIAGNKLCSFEISTSKTTKEFVTFDYRVAKDGSSGINRIKTFIYDVLLMTNDFTRNRHFGFLVHDNIFASAGRDDMAKSLNYLDKQSKAGKSFQYIVTINKDEFESSLHKFTFKYNDLTRAKFTRSNPFLNDSYMEL